MTQYIPKAAVVKEIKRRIANLDKLGNRLYIQTDFPEQYRLIHGYESILSFLDTLEVKEVDLEKELDEYLDTHDYEFVFDDYLELVKHFFELGYNVQKINLKETGGEAIQKNID